MAMLLLSSRVIDIEGQGPGGIYRQDQCGQHIQKPPRKVKKHPSDDPFARQRYFQLLMQFIRDNATEEFVMAWSAYAAAHPKKTKKGEKLVLSWHQMFVAYNFKFWPPGLPIIHWPPGYTPA